MAADQLTFEIVTPAGAKLSEEVSELTAPSVGGEVGILPGHLPLLAALRPGIVTWKSKSGGGSAAVAWGFLEVSGGKASVLTDKYITKPELDIVAVRAELKELDRKIEHFEGSRATPEYTTLVNEELWCAAQMELNGDPPPPTVSYVGAYGAAPEEVVEGEGSEAKVVKEH